MNPTTSEAVLQIVNLMREARKHENPRIYALGRHGTIYAYLSEIQAHNRADKNLLVSTIEEIKTILEVDAQ